VAAVRESCTQQGPRSERLVLDLTAVGYVDGPGSQLLRELVIEGVEIGTCSGFIAALLELED
jgi:hypothetical protein